MMRVRFLTCFIIVLWTQAISISSLHQNFSSQQRGLNSSNSNIQTKQPIRNYGRIKEKKFEQAYALNKKANRGKGTTTGGANVNYRSEPRRSKNSAPSMLSWISTVCVSFVLIFVFSLHAKLL